jgi:hypothetical protein
MLHQRQRVHPWDRLMSALFLLCHLALFILALPFIIVAILVDSKPWDDDSNG